MNKRHEERKAVNYQLSTDYFNYRHRANEDSHKIDDEIALA